MFIIFYGSLLGNFMNIFGGNFYIFLLDKKISWVIGLLFGSRYDDLGFYLFDLLMRRFVFRIEKV